MSSAGVELVLVLVLLVVCMCVDLPLGAFHYWYLRPPALTLFRSARSSRTCGQLDCTCLLRPLIR